MRRPGIVVLLSLAVSLWAPAALAERPKTGFVPQDIVQGPVTPTGLVPYNTLYINRCANGCPIRVGTSNSINDTWGIPANATLTSFSFGDEAWQKVMTCVRDVMSPFNIQVTDTNPGSANHFEVMVAGSPTDIGMNANYGGVAPGGCTATYMNNALVFVFSDVWSRGQPTCDQACVEEICATVAQEIGHTWKSMDHVRIAADPMTYFAYQGRRYFQNMSAQCGSDCTNGTAPNGETCDGVASQSHSCRCTGGLETQNSYSVVLDLFGKGAGTPPIVTFVTPTIGAGVQAGFTVTVEATDDSNTIPMVELRIGGQLVGTLMTAPYTFTAPAGLAEGPLMIEATAYDLHGTPGKATLEVVLGPPCEDEDDCPRETDVCVSGRCVPGPSVDGGLGTTCTLQTECLSNLCAMDSTGGYCVEVCDAAGECPDDFGCLDAGNGQLVCWPGYDDGSGCGCSSSGRGGPASMALLFFTIVVLTWRRRR